MNSATSIYAAVTMFSFLGHVAHVKDVPVSDVAKSGLTLLFVAFPALLNLLAWSNFFSALFFLMCVTLGVDSVFGFADYWIKWFEDMYPWLKKKFGKKYEVLILMGICFIWSLMFCSEGGIYNFDMWDDNCTHIQLLFVFVAEVILIPWVWGVDRLSELIFLRTGDRIPRFYIFILKIFCPFFACLMLHFGYVIEWASTEQRTEEWKYSEGMIWGARMLWFLPMCAFIISIFFPLKEIRPIEDHIMDQFGIVFENEEGLKWW